MLLYSKDATKSQQNGAELVNPANTEKDKLHILLTILTKENDTDTLHNQKLEQLVKTSFTGTIGEQSGEIYWIAPASLSIM